MAAPTSNFPESGEEISVIDSRFCFPYPIELTLKRKFLSTNFLDVHGNIVFKEQGTFFRSRRVLSDVTGNPLFNIKPKRWSWHMRWRALRGDSPDPEHLLFSMKNSSFFSWSKSGVFLASNTEEKKIDFKIKRSFFGGSCTIYKSDSDIIIAQMRKKRTSKNILKRKTRILTIYPEVDSAFIVALIMILNRQDADVAASIAVGASVGLIVACFV